MKRKGAKPALVVYEKATESNTSPVHLSLLLIATSLIGLVECLSKSEIERRVLSRGWRFAAPTRRLDAPDAPEADQAAPRARTFVRQAHLQWEHDEIDSRAVSENVDLDKVDDGGFERLRRALHSMHPRVGVRIWKREATPWGVDQ